MIKFTQILTENNVQQGFVCSSKKRLFETIARLAAESAIADKNAVADKNTIAEKNLTDENTAKDASENIIDSLIGTAEGLIENAIESAVENTEKSAVENISEHSSENHSKKHQDSFQTEQAKLEKLYFDCLLQREKLGNSALGAGVAMPKARLLEGDKVIAVFIQLETPIDYEAADHREVDLILALFVPEKDCQYYGQCLPELMDNLADRNLCKRLRTAQSEEEIWHILKAADAQSEQNIEHHTDHLLET